MSIRNEKGKSYLNDRIIISKDEYDVVYSTEFLGSSPFCELCTCVLRTKNDEEEAKKYGCCYSCAVKWVYPNIQKWATGWRPDKELLQTSIRDMITTRISL